ncbi:MAG TPA: hypothetical protein VM737_03700 [Gemmatimonadota bacterium]|nr:hypothetical protein [Gemmatimonadota bacterium]
MTERSVARRRSFPSARALGLLAGAIGLGACAGGDEGAMEEFAPSSDDAAIVSVSLGTNDTDTWDPSRAGTEFPEGTDRVVVWYRWEDAEEGLRIDNRWSTGGEIILEQGENVTQPAGDAAWFLKSASGGALPAGAYEVELLEDGEGVTTIPFRVGGESAAAAAGTGMTTDEVVFASDPAGVASESLAMLAGGAGAAEASGQVPKLRLGLAAAADYSPVYPTNVLPTTNRLSVVFRFPEGERHGRLIGKLIVVDVGEEAPPGFEVGVVEIALQGEDRGALHYTLPRPFPPGAYRLDVTADGEPWESLDFRVAPPLESGAVTDADQLMPLDPGTVWTYTFSQEAGQGARLDLPESLKGADGVYRATATLSIAALEDPGARLEVRRGGESQSEEWLRAGEAGVVSTQAREDGVLTTLDPPRPLFPMPSGLPREWQYAMADGSFTLTYRMWGPIPVRGPAGEAPGYVVLVQHDGPAVTTAERHFIPGIGMVREVILLAMQGRMLSRQEMVLQTVTPGGSEASSGGQPR